MSTVTLQKKMFETTKPHQHTRSVGATGGVYKGQGRNQHRILTNAY